MKKAGDMLTFSEALTQLKAGEDMRHASWPRRDYIRAVIVAGKPEARRFPAAVAYSPTQAELFGQDWNRA
jgi:hypothetical protein